MDNSPRPCTAQTVVDQAGLAHASHGMRRPAWQTLCRLGAAIWDLCVPNLPSYILYSPGLLQEKSKRCLMRIEMTMLHRAMTVTEGRTRMCLQ